MLSIFVFILVLLYVLVCTLCRFNDGHDSKCSKGLEGQRHQLPKNMEASGSTVKYNYCKSHSLNVNQIDAMSVQGKSIERVYNFL